jgi:hypothetical protein
MIKAALIQQALAEYVYIYGGYKQVKGKFKQHSGSRQADHPT